MKKLTLVVMSLVLVLFTAGCSSKKDVGFDATSKTKTNNQAKDKSVSPLKKGEVVNVKDNMDAIDNNTNGDLSYVNVVESNVNGKVVKLRSVHFAFDKYKLSNEMLVIAKDNYKIINPLVNDNANLKIKLEGNCDEWGTDEYNYALGLKRAKSAKDKLVNDGINPNSIVLVSFGESNPICHDKTSLCWKKNRRVDYKLLP
jgi:peptidoglycan-associated lipoprotein